MRTALVALTAAASVMVAPAGADAFSKKLEHRNHALRAKVIKLHGKRAPGRDIVKYGLPNGKRPSYTKIRAYFNVMRRQIMPRPAARYVAVGKPYQPPAGGGTVHAGGTLSAIASCESGGNPRAVSPSGAYRGKYQFDYSTWASVGGSGDPAAAPEAEQDRRAAILYARRGAAPWPVCGK